MCANSVGLLGQSPKCGASRPRKGPVDGDVLPDGETRFANSGIGPWLDTLHPYGTHVTTSALLGEPDGPEEYLSPAEEEQALAELGRLSEELRETDPAAFVGYEGFLWPELLDRWLF